MCGIAGWISSAGPVDMRLMPGMLKQIAHRGPDDSGIYEEASDKYHVALGHQRLSILDLSQSGHQPMTNEDGSIWIVFNGEIYNYQSLRKELIKKGHKFSSSTDTETILHLYEEYGSECVQHLRGMFAFALWDSRQDILFLARDRLGKKPLYYLRVPGGLFFASEIQALYQIKGIKLNLDYTALDLYLAHSYIPSPYSIYKEIRKLPPASILTVMDNQLAVQKYWHLEFAPKLNISFEDAQKELLAHLEEAVKIRLYSDVSIGCFLSGGTDSSTVVALMSRFAASRVKTFSIGFPDKKFDETSYARTIAAHYATEHHEFQVKPKSIEILPELVRHYGEPYADSSALPTWYLSEMTRECVTVALNGDGGDESFAGYNWHQTGAWLADFNRFCPSAWAGRLQRIIPGKLGNKARQAKRLAELIAQDPGSRFADLRTEFKPDLRLSMYAEEMRKHLNGAAEEYLLSFYRSCTCTDEIDRMLYTDIMSYLPEELLVKVDRATMAHSLEARSPLLDHKLMEFAARLPSEFKLNKGRKKHILLQTVAPLFPKGLLERPKMGFSVPLQAWFGGELKEYVRERILHGKMADSGLFDKAFLSRAANGETSQPRSSSGLQWRLLMLAEWMDQYA